MRRDFTLKVYTALLQNIIKSGYAVQSFEKYLNLKDNLQIYLPALKVLILRHDVDRKPQRALVFAQLEHEFNICSTYYFRIVPVSFDAGIIIKIAELGHEIGYHYEDLTLANGDVQRAGELFEQHLKQLRDFYPVKTICMHGSPLSRWDNRLIWKTINYREYDLMGEPYLDLDYNDVLYLSDTGRKWNNQGISLRDKVETKFTNNFRTTFDIIDAFNRDHIPAKIMINAHPQRWNDEMFSWLYEYISQNGKNIIKNIMVKSGSRS